MNDRSKLLVSSIWVRAITGQGVVNGRLITEFRKHEGQKAGTLVCEPAPAGVGDDLTVTRQGARFLDLGTFTPRR